MTQAVSHISIPARRFDLDPRRRILAVPFWFAVFDLLKQTGINPKAASDADVRAAIDVIDRSNTSDRRQ